MNFYGMCNFRSCWWFDCGIIINLIDRTHNLRSSAVADVCISNWHSRAMRQRNAREYRSNRQHFVTDSRI